ncbi:plasma membrane fusion protein PRM1 [Purpureocillium lavendulum]|uniref:Plasma membrane fusion protein PRM1 n=1 Tax=Purpureocillium lavendulum TaxID=1247861 RepID=A0AB34FR05_9HYPO|nr:plasma membrane fusion protein PRM1 [Purpureocillium lavendulum]
MFSSSRKRNAAAASSYPEVPASLRSGSDSFETSEMPKTLQARAATSSSITPYLNLPSKLSQIWINRWTILLLLVLVRVVLLIAQLNDNVGDAKVKALSACSKVEDIGSAMASMPHYLSVGVNDLAAGGIEKAVHGMVKGLDLVLEGVEAMIVFYINFLTATYVCLITALVHGSLDVVASVTEDATKAFNKVIDGATTEIQNIAGDLTKAINKITDGIENSIIGHFTPDIPKIDFSKPINELKGFDLNSSDFVQDVQKLNKNLPNFEQVQNLTKQAISIPFSMARDGINQSFSGYKFDRDVFPLAQKQKLTFCSDNDTLNNFFTRLFELIQKAKIAFVVLLSILAVAAIIPMAWFEIRRWRRQQKHARLIEKNQYEPMDVVYIASRPVTAACGIKVASRFSGRRQILTRWCVAYATSVPAIFVLSLALAGFFSCFCQFILLRVVEKEVPALAGEVGAFAGQVVKSLENVSDQWAADANGVVTGLNDDINKEVLVYVVNATDAVNNTLNVFLDTMEEGLETVFNGTILLDPIKTVLHCVIGIKIESVQKGLTWVHDHARIDFPLFDNDTFSMGANKSISGDSDLNTFLASPSSVTTDEVSGAVQHVTNWLHDNLVQEALISTGILLVYIIVVLMGVTRTLAGMAMPDKTHGEGGMRYTGEGRPPLSPRTADLTNDPTWEPRDEKAFMSGGQGARGNTIPLGLHRSSGPSEARNKF